MQGDLLIMEREEHFLRAQHAVFGEMLDGAHASPRKELEFIISNAPLFRYFGEHLPGELGRMWLAVPESDVARAYITKHYERFAREIFRLIETMDPDAQTALTEAVEAGDGDKVSRILETNAAIVDRRDE